MPLPVSPADVLSPDEHARYARHLTLPQVGEEGQRRLKNASVLLVGAGGLGSPMALYLAAAGVGRLGLVDDDRVDASNLQRQVLYGTDDVGRDKLKAAAERLRDLNPHVELTLHRERFGPANALRLVEGYDVVADGTDTFATRYLVNDACVLAGVPLAFGSVDRFDGQVSVFGHAGGPCYRCLFPAPPPPGEVPSCAEGGVLGVVPGLVGTLQATEVVKLLTGIGEPLAGRLLTFDALSMRFRTLRLRRNPACPVCGDAPTITSVEASAAACGLVPEVSAEAFLSSERRPLLDVREPKEYEADHLGGTLVPLGELAERLEELEGWRGERVVVHCRSGARSARAVELLRREGFDAVNLRGGLLAVRQAEER